MGKYIQENKDIKLNKEVCKDVIVQLDEYFNKKGKEFQLPLSIGGTEFRKKFGGL
ncbi:MAG TPA: hypothetical protein VK071_07805 [Tissierellales bacterium]|nr:hypothetical protein [Tissierellales bacterium]